MQTFPDESTMSRSQDGSEPIRGGSIGLNRILGSFVEGSGTDRNPKFTAVLISAYTVLRNVIGTYPNASDTEIEEAFVKDINLFLDYYNTYLANTMNVLQREKKALVVVYFPDYRKVSKDIIRDQSGKKTDPMAVYHRFLSRYDGKDEMVRQLDHVFCFWLRAGDSSYPHKELARKFKDIATIGKGAYSSGDKIALISHIPLDYHIASRLRGVCVLESYTGKLKESDQFKFKLDKEGRIPFLSVTHGIFGDSVFIKPQITPKIKKLLLEQAEKERWKTRREDDIAQRIAKTANIPLSELRKFDFS